MTGKVVTTTIMMMTRRRRRRVMAPFGSQAPPCSHGMPGQNGRTPTSTLGHVITRGPLILLSRPSDPIPLSELDDDDRHHHHHHHHYL
jgi:hypothetical protein